MTIEERTSTKNKYNITRWDEYGVNYWGIPKCMNTSVKAMFLSAMYNVQSGGDVKTYNTFQFAHHEELDRYITPEEANSNGNINFTIVREPYGRVKSMYKDFVHKRPNIGREIKDLNIDENTSFEKFVKQVSKTCDETCNIHLASQYSLIKDATDLVIIPMNSLKVKVFINQIGLNCNIPHVNATPDMKVRMPYSIQKLIQERYAEDFKLPY